MNLAVLIVCAVLATAITNSVFGHEAGQTKPITGKERMVALFIPIAIFVIGLWIKMSTGA